MSSTSFDPFAGGIIQRVSPCTPPQREVLASSQVSDEANTGFNEAVTVSLDGVINQQLMVKSFATLIARHEAFHVTFSRKGDEICLQEDKRAKVVCVDLRSSNTADQQQYLKNLARNIAISPMNLEEGPLVFAWLVQLADNHHNLFIAAHHVICDGWTFGLLLQELAEIYGDAGSDATLAPAPSFMDFAEQQEVAQIVNTDIDYWKSKFELPPPTLDLPLDSKRPPQRPFAAARYDYDVGGELAQSLRKTSAKLKTSLVNTVLAAYFVLLHRLTANEDIVVGLPVAGQAALNQLKMAGHMVQLLPIRVQFNSSTPFSTLLNQVKSEVLNASEHANFTFGTLVQGMKLDRSRVPLISTIFNIDQAMPPLNFGDAVATVASLPRAAENFELFLNVLPTNDSLILETTYSTALFSEKSVNSWLIVLEQILSQIVNDSETEIGDFKLAQELPHFVSQLNETQSSVESSSLIQAFYKSAAQYPDNPAIVANGQTISYKDLYEGVKDLISTLQDNNVAVGDVVGICCRRSEHLLISVLAIHHVGAAYLPLDPSFPKDRLNYMVEDSGAAFIVGDETADRILVDTDVRLIKLTSVSQDKLNDDHELAPLADFPADQLAYIIYTSGSTGKPKGVKVSHQSMINFLESMASKPGMSPHQSLLAVTTLAFDISILELFLPLVVGGCVVLAAEEDLKESESLANLIEHHNIDLMQATPATWRLLLGSSWRDKSLNQRSLVALCGGEPLPPDLAEMLLSRVSQLWNMFGPTETTVWSTCCQIVSIEKAISIGNPIANTQVLILDEHQQLLPACVPGELYIGGQGVALGYHNRETLTAEHFIEHPRWGRIYRTGDLAKWSADGELQHLGRLDDQIKLRGYRIELGEIEHAIVRTDLVKQVAAYLWRVTDHDTRIVVCCVAKPDNAMSSAGLDTTALRKKLRSTLPAYMVPQYFLSLDSLPLTPNGKVDKRALPRPEIPESSAMLGGGALENNLERELAEIWFDVIQPIRPLGREDNFFDVGGHSLLALEVIRQIEIRFSVTLSIADLIQNKLAYLAETIEKSNKNEIDEYGLAVALAARSERRLSPDQARWLDLQLRDATVGYYNLPAAWQLDGNLDVDGFLRAFKRVVDRQTALRTCVIPLENGDLHLGLLHTDDVEWIQFEDLSAENNGLLLARDEIDRMSAMPFKLIGQPLLRARLYKLDENKYLFFVCPNQIIFDGWSFDLLWKELEVCYLSAIHNEAAKLDHLEFEYRDHCEWMRLRAENNVVLDSKSLHKNSLVDSAFLEVKSPPQEQSQAAHRGQLVSRSTAQLNLDGFSKVNAFCEKHSFRLHEILVAAFTDALAREFQLTAFSIALPVTGRYNASVINLIGGFVSLLPFSVRTHLQRDFGRHCESTAADLKLFHGQQDLSFSELLMDTQHMTKPTAALLSASFAFQDIRNRHKIFAGMSSTQLDIDRSQLEFPLDFWVRVQSDGILLVADYDQNVIEKSLAEALLGQMLDRLNELDKPDETNAPPEVVAEEIAKPSLWRKLFG